jgi:hypothetical protein
MAANYPTGMPEVRWSANEVVRWPLFDPVTLVASEGGLRVERHGLGARLARRGSIPLVPWRSCRTERSSARADEVVVDLGGVRISLTGAGAERAMGLVHAAGQGREDARLPAVFEASSAVLPWSRPWAAIGPGGIVQGSVAVLGTLSLQVWTPDQLIGARVEADGTTRLCVEGADPVPLVGGRGVLGALARLLVRRLGTWRPDPSTVPDEEAPLEQAVVWGSRERVSLAWLRAAPDGITLVGADGERLDARAETLRDLSDGDAETHQVRFLTDHGEQALWAPPGEPLAQGLWDLLRARMFRQRAAEPIDGAWRRLGGNFSRVRLEDERGGSWEVGPVRVGACPEGLCVLSPAEAPVEAGATVRVQLVNGRRRYLLRAQVAGPMPVDELPVGLRRVAERAPGATAPIVLRPLQTAPEVASQDRALFRLDLAGRDIPVALTFDDGTETEGRLTDVGGLGVGVHVPPPMPAEPGVGGVLIGLDALLGDGFARCRIRLVHRTRPGPNGWLVGCRLEDLSPAQVDRLHGLVLALERGSG